MKREKDPGALPTSLASLAALTPDLTARLVSDYHAGGPSPIGAEEFARVRGLAFRYGNLQLLGQLQGVTMLPDGALPCVEYEGFGQDERVFEPDRLERRTNTTPPCPDALLQLDRDPTSTHVYESVYRVKKPLGAEAADYNKLLHYQRLVDQGVLAAVTLDVTGPLAPAFLRFVWGEAGSAFRPLPDVSVLWTIDLGDDAPRPWKLPVKVGRRPLPPLGNPRLESPAEGRRVQGLEHALGGKRPGRLDVPGVTRPTQGFDHILDLMTRWTIPVEHLPDPPRWGETPALEALGLDEALAPATALASMLKRLRRLDPAAAGALAGPHEPPGAPGRSDLEVAALRCLRALVPAVGAEAPPAEVASAFWRHGLAARPDLIMGASHLRTLEAARRRALTSSLEAISERVARGSDAVCTVLQVTPAQVDAVLDRAFPFVEERLQNDRQREQWRRFDVPAPDRPAARRAVHDQVEALAAAERERLAAEGVDDRERRRSEGWSGPAEGVGMSIEEVVFDVLYRHGSRGARRRYDRVARFLPLEAELARLADRPSSRRVARLVEGRRRPLTAPEELDRDERVAQLEREARLRSLRAVRQLRLGVPEAPRQALDKRQRERDERLARARDEFGRELRAAKKMPGKRGDRRAEFEARIVALEAFHEEAERRHARDSIDDHVRTIGGAARDFLVELEVREVPAEVKLIYVVRPAGQVLVAEEERGSHERPTHSELAGGGHVYGAGQLVLSRSSRPGEGGWRLVEIDNGSGHYRPSVDTLPYVMRRVVAAGIDVSGTRLVDALLPGRPLVWRLQGP